MCTFVLCTSDGLKKCYCLIIFNHHLANPFTIFKKYPVANFPFFLLVSHVFDEFFPPRNNTKDGIE